MPIWEREREDADDNKRCLWIWILSSFIICGYYWERDIWPTHGKEKLRFFSLLVWIVQRWLGRNLIYQLCWRGVDRSSKGSTQASDAGVDNECHLSTFMNYWNQFPQLSRLPLTDPPYWKKTGKPNKEYGLKHLLPVKALQKAVWYLRSRRLLSWKRNAVNTKFQDISIIIIILLFDREGLQVWLSPTPFVSLLYTSLFFLQSCGLSPPPPIWLTFTSIYIDNWSVDWLIYYIALTLYIW